MLLPVPERRDEIHFHVAKGLSYAARIRLGFALMAAGLVLQAVLVLPYSVVGAVPGLVVVLAGVLLLLPQGYRNVVDRETPSGEWRPTGRDEVQRIVHIDRKQRAWDEDVLDITSVSGCAVFFALAIAAGGSVMFLAGLSVELAFLAGLNAAVMLAPFWVTGVRSYLKKDRLVVKAEMLMKMEDAFRKSAPRPGEEFLYQIQTADAGKDAGSTPYDVKALLAFREASPSFLGLQMQVNINSVQGKDFPYFYCVLVAQPEFGGFPQARAPRDVVVEDSRTEGVDVRVIRQHTTRKTGFHTAPQAAVALFEFALAEARRAVAAAG